MKKPNLFLIGEQKAGTTTLHQMLVAHPEVFMTPLKEPGFFCSDLHAESDAHHKRQLFFPYRHSAEYLQLFSGWGEEKYGGESSSLYFYSQKAIQNIAEFNPDAKILILLRDPVTFIHSLHSQYIKEQTEDVTSLEKALDLEPQRKRGQCIPPMASAPSLLFYSQRIQYGKHLEHVYNFFPKRSVHVEFFEELISDTFNAFVRIANFLNIDKVFTPSYIQGNPRKERRFQSIYKFFNNPKLKFFIFKTVPLSLQFRIKRNLDAIFLRPARRIELSQALRTRIQEMSTHEVHHLENVIGRKTPWEWAHADLHA